MKFNVGYDGYKPSPGQVCDPKSDVDLSGYVPTEKRIKSIMAAGASITAVLSSQYDYQDDVDDFDIDPTRSGNYDLVDAQRDMVRATTAHDRLKRAKIDAETAKAAKAAKVPEKASDAS